MNKGQKVVAALGAAAAVCAGAPNASAAVEVDVASHIESKVPVPGGFTAGSWNISNQRSTIVPAGSTYLVTFSQLDGTLTPSSLTLTRWSGASQITKLSANQFRITLTSSLNPGAEVSGVWGDAHMFNTNLRDKVSISEESTPGAKDVDAANDLMTFNNAGQGF